MFKLFNPKYFKIIDLFSIMDRPKPSFTYQIDLPLIGRSYIIDSLIKSIFPEIESSLKVSKKFSKQLINIHGPPGIGKSWIYNELLRVFIEYNNLDPNLKSMNIILGYLDFNHDQDNLGELLYNFRNRIYHFSNIPELKFPLFDTHYLYYYIKLKGKRISKESLEFNELSKKLEKFGYSKISKIISKVVKFPVLSDIYSIIKDILDLKKELEYDEYFVELETLPIEELEKRLPLSLSLDLENNFKDQDIETKMVLLFDSYEKIWDNIHKQPQKGNVTFEDDWLRNLLYHLESGKIVTFGRLENNWNKLDKNWDKIVTNHELKGLNRKNSENILKIFDQNIFDELLNHIISNSKGVPLYLKLAGETYLKIKDKEEPKPEMFPINIIGTDGKSLLDVFLEHIPSNEKNILLILSCLKEWNIGIAEIIEENFHIGYTIDSFEQIEKLSFIVKNENTYSMHSLIHSALQEQFSLNQNDFIKYHNFILEYFVQKITEQNSIGQFLIYLNKIEYSLGHHKSTNKAVINKFISFLANGNVHFSLIEFIDKITRYFDEEDAMSILNSASLIMQDLGEFNLAITYIQKAISYSIEKYGEFSIPAHASQGNLVSILAQIGDLENAIIENERLLVISKNLFGEEDFMTLSGKGNKAFLHYLNGETEEAYLLNKTVIEGMKSTIGEDHQNTIYAIGNQAMICRKLGKLEKALKYNLITVSYLDKHLGENNMETLKSKNLLSQIYLDLGEYEKAVSLLKNNYEKYSEIIGEMNPLTLQFQKNFALALSKKGDKIESKRVFKDILKKSLELYGSDHQNISYLENKIKEL